MIRFREKQYIVQDLMNEVIEHLKLDGQKPNIIKEDQAKEVASTNSNSRVIYSFTRNKQGFYEMKLMDKELYNYTRKLLGDQFLLRITSEDKDMNMFTCESEFKGRILDAIDIIGRKFNLSVVVR